MKSSFSLLVFAILLLTLSCDRENMASPVENPSEEKRRSAEQTLTHYAIEIEGVTANEHFARTGCLVISNGLEAANTGNGLNSIDIGLVSGYPAGNSQPGAIHYVTNSALCQVTKSGCNHIPIAAAVDAAFVQTSSNDRIIEIVLDEKMFAPSGLGSVLHDNLLSSFSPNILTFYDITAGSISITFSPDDKSITGEIELMGSEIIEAVKVVNYQATFTGTKVDSSCF